MAFEFTALPRAAQRAAFAKMGAEDKAESTRTQPVGRGLGSGARHRQLATRTSTDPAEDLRAAYERGHTSVRTLTGGRAADEVELVQLADGRLAVRKQQSGEETRSEYLAGRVANALGINTVVTAQISDEEVVTTFVEGRTGGELQKDAAGHLTDGKERWRASEAEADRHAALDGGREIGMLDWLTNNHDRNSLNWIVSPDGTTVVPIDHGSAWWLPDRHSEEVFPDDSPFVRAWVRPSSSDPEEATLRPRWTADELAEVRTQLGSVASEFRGAEEQRWYRSMLRRLTMLEAAL